LAAPAAELQTFELPSELVDTSTPGGVLEHGRTVPKVHVLLPDGYRADSKRGYPVLWLLHGANGGTDTWIPGITTLAAGFPGIVVMPDGGQFGMYMDWWNDGVRGGPAWSTYHLQVLRQEIDRRYPIRPGRRWHAIAGISMGGQGALRYAAMLPGYFGSVVGFSAAFPDMQSGVPQVGLDLLPVPNLGGRTVYEAIFGSADGAFAEGNSPQALAANYAHLRLYLTSGDGVNCRRVSEAVRSGTNMVILSDRGVDPENAPIPALLAVAGVHHHLIREGTRTQVGLVIESGEPREVEAARDLAASATPSDAGLSGARTPRRSNAVEGCRGGGAAHGSR